MISILIEVEEKADAPNRVGVRLRGNDNGGATVAEVEYADAVRAAINAAIERLAQETGDKATQTHTSRSVRIAQDGLGKVGRG